MATLGIDGLVSSLDTTSIITQLMTLEARPQTLLKNTLSSTNTFLADLRSINSSVSAIATAAKDAGKAGSLALFSATSSATSVTATTRQGSSAGSISFRTDQTAQAQSIVTAAAPAWPSSPAVLTIVAKDGTTTEVTAASSSLQDVADAMNAEDAGVVATRVAAGTAPDGTLQYRLQLTAAESGTDGAFTIYRGSAADVTAGTAVNLATETGAATVAAARDAKITLWAGTTAEQTLSSSTNTFSDVLSGVDITISQVEPDPVTVTLSQNTTAATSVASGLVAKLISLFGTISDKTKVTSTTNPSGSVSVSGGPFTGDSTVRRLKDALMSAVSDPVDDRSLSSIGIETTRTGTITFDTAKFGEALKSDPSGTQAMFAALAARVEKAATTASDPEDGYLTTKVTGQEDAVRRLGENISAWDLRLEKRRSILQRQYTAMETALGSLQSQSTWISSQLSSLTSSKS